MSSEANKEGTVPPLEQPNVEPAQLEVVPERPADIHTSGDLLQENSDYNKNPPLPTPAFKEEIRLPRAEAADEQDANPEGSEIHIPEYSPIPGPRAGFSVTGSSILSPSGRGGKSPLRMRSYDKPK